MLWLFLFQGFTEPMSDKLLPDLLPEEKHVFTLVLDLNETLVYSDWQVYYVSCYQFHFCANFMAQKLHLTSIREY